GGGCLPKDIRAFMARAEELGVDQAVTFLKDIDDINLRRRARVVDLGYELLDGCYAGATVCVLGAAFKPNSDDIRDSPALDVAAAIQRQGATVTVYDPAAVDNARRAHPELTYAESALAAALGADLVLLLTEWSEFREMDPRVLGAVVAHPRIVDGRDALRPEEWRAAGRVRGHGTWAVVGLTSHQARPAYGVARFLQRQGRKVVPINPAGERVLGEQGYRSLADVPFDVDVVDIFRRSEQAGGHVDEA